MKHKNVLKTLVFTMAAVVMMGASSITAFAGGPDYVEPDTSTTETEAPEPTPSTGSDALTPEGNLTLVDDATTVDESEKQFITVVSKNGHYFYLIIDRDNEGDNNVYFLNLVDEEDLMALIEEDGGTTATPTPTATASVVTPSATEEPAEETKNEKSSSGIIPILILLAVLGGGGAFYYIKFVKPKKTVKSDETLDDLDFDEEYETEEPDDIGEDEVIDITENTEDEDETDNK